MYPINDPFCYDLHDNHPSCTTRIRPQKSSASNHNKIALGFHLLECITNPSRDRFCYDSNSCKQVEARRHPCRKKPGFVETFPAIQVRGKKRRLSVDLSSSHGAAAGCCHWPYIPSLHLHSPSVPRARASTSGSG